MYGLIFMARYVLKSLNIGFRGEKFEIFREHELCMIDSLELFACTALCFTFSRISYLGADFLLRDCRSFTLGKLYICL